MTDSIDKAIIHSTDVVFCLVIKEMYLRQTQGHFDCMIMM